MHKKSKRVSVRKQALDKLKFRDAEQIYIDFLTENKLDRDSIANEKEILSSINSKLHQGKVNFEISVKFK
jgi:hypothetical protein